MIPSGLHDNLIFLIGEFTKNFNDQLTNQLKDAGLDVSGEQYAILATLFYNDGITQKNIAESIKRDKTTVSRVIDSMIRKNLLVRIPAQNDKRERLIYLTEKGKSIQKEGVEIGGKLYAQALNGLEEHEVRQAIKLLTIMSENIK